MSNKSFEEIRKTIEKIGNPNSLPITTIYARVKKGQSIESAILEPKTDRYKKSYNKLYFENSSNPHNFTWSAVKARLKRGYTIEEAIYTPKKNNTKNNKNISINYKRFLQTNPLNLSWNTVYRRLKSGWSYSEAIGSKIGKGKTTLYQLFKEEENPYGLKWKTVLARLNRGAKWDTALSEPEGHYSIDKFKNGWVMYEGQWTNVDNLEMIFDEETTENMIKSGVKVEKLFAKIER